MNVLGASAKEFEHSSDTECSENAPISILTGYVYEIYSYELANFQLEKRF